VAGYFLIGYTHTALRPRPKKYWDIAQQKIQRRHDLLHLWKSNPIPKIVGLMIGTKRWREPENLGPAPLFNAYTDTTVHFQFLCGK
jgi:hypothetical protein